MELSNLRPAEGSVHSNNFRRGRGHGSGNGKTAGKGHKGQKARSGAPRTGFEGGQMPLYRRLPKRGFTNRNTKEIVALNLSVLEVFDNGTTVDVDALIAKGIVRNPRDGVKILGNGELTKKTRCEGKCLQRIREREDRGTWWNSRGGLMFTTLKNAFKIKEIRKKIMFTFLMLVVIRLGSQLPVPGVDRTYFAKWFSQQTGDAFNFFNAFTGGSFLNMSILALNITPYITSSIIMQLMTIAIPKLEEMQRDGADGRKKIASITRYVTVVLALVEATAMAVGFGRQGLLEVYNVMNIITVIAALTAGSAFLMWIGERITENGVGNGISIVLTINILSRMPQDITQLFEQFVIGKSIAKGVVAAIIIIAIIVLMVVLVIILNDGVRKIPVQYAKKVQGRKMVGGQTTNIPLKVNTSGVIPVILHHP